MFSIQPGIILSGKGAKLETTEDGANLTSKASLMYIEVPVNALVSFPLKAGKVFIGAGPYYGMAITGKNKLEGTTTEDGQKTSGSIEEDIEFGDDGEYKRSDFGVNFLGGYQLNNGFNIHAGYGLGLSNISTISEAKLKNRVLSVGIGYSF